MLQAILLIPFYNSSNLVNQLHFVIGKIGKLFCHRSNCSFVAGHSGKMFHAVAVIGHGSLIRVQTIIQHDPSLAH